MGGFSFPTMTETAGLAIMFLTLALAKFGYLDKIFQRIHAELNELRTGQAEDKVKIDLFWSVIQSRVASLVKAPTHERLDELVERFEGHIATLPELAELQSLLAVRAVEEGLRPIQDDAIALVLLFVADRIASKHKAEKTGKPDRPFLRRHDDRTPEEKRAEQLRQEAEQIEADERHPHVPPVVLAAILEEMDKEGE